MLLKHSLKQAQRLGRPIHERYLPTKGSELRKTITDAPAPSPAAISALPALPSTNAPRGMQQPTAARRVALMAWVRQLLVAKKDVPTHFFIFNALHGAYYTPTTPSELSGEEGLCVNAC